MLASAVVAIYGVEAYLSRCIESLVRQTYRDLEIVLVDDGSPDGCPAICDSYASRYPNVKVIHKPNGGLVSARKAGLAAATGEYVGYVDGDDWVEPGAFEHLVRAAKESDADMVCAGFAKETLYASKMGAPRDSMLHSVRRIVNQASRGVYSRREIEQRLLPVMMFEDGANQPYIFSYAWNKLFRRDLLAEAQERIDDSVTLGEDAACVYPALARANIVCVTEDCDYHYVQHPGSMLKTSSDLHADAGKLQRLYNCMSDISADYPAEWRFREGLRKYLGYLFVSRSGGLARLGRELRSLCYGDRIIGKRVVVCGAGTFGQHLHKRIRYFGCCDEALWVDEDADSYQSYGLPVSPFSSLRGVSADYYLIASLEVGHSNQMRDLLAQQGIDSDRVILPLLSRADLDFVFDYMDKEQRCVKGRG